MARLLIHELDKPEEFILEMWRIVRPGGRLIIIENTSDSLGDYDESCGYKYIEDSILREYLYLPNFIVIEYIDMHYYWGDSGFIYIIEKKEDE
jgi:ubiquinone/menaquinone biosynthesis C-methylase UbiE